jgi:hypothetical protein
VTIKYQMPCLKKEPWTPSADRLNVLGLAPQDAATVHNAYVDSNKRVWATVKPLCAAAVGSPELAEKIGPDTCIFLVLDIEREKDPDAVAAAKKQVGEIRAGLRAMPGPNERLNPVAQIFLTLTGESKSFENELAQSFGPEEAHRLVNSGEMCMHHSTFGGSPKK